MPWTIEHHPASASWEARRIHRLPLPCEQIEVNWARRQRYVRLMWAAAPALVGVGVVLGVFLPQLFGWL